MSIKLNVAIRVPDEAPREFDLSFDKSIITVGRDRENDIQIPLSTVSRRHARIYEEQGDWFVEDLRSTHGTKVNGQILGLGGKKLLSEGDQIQIVHAFITYHRINAELLDETATSEEKTSVVARKMVQGVLGNSDKTPEVPHLVVMNGPLQGTTVDFGPDVTEVVLGRGDNCDIRLEDVNISRRHAVVRRNWNEFLIEDLGSKNGVILNGQRTSGETRLKDADEIYLGAIHLTFVNHQANILGKLGEIPAFANELKKDVGKNEKNTQALPKEKPTLAESISQPPEKLALEPAKTEKSADVTVSQAGMMAARRKFGAVEYVLLALVGLVLVGLIVGVVVALG